MRLNPNATPEQQKIANELWANMKDRNKPVQTSQQALPVQQPIQPVSQSDLMAQRQAIYNQLNSFMQNEYMPTITKDTQLQQMRARQQELTSTIDQNRISFLNSLGFTEDKLRDPNLDPALRNFISAGLNSWVNSQPEYQQIQQITQQSQQYIQQTYPELATKQRTLSDISRFGFNPQAQPTQAQGTPPPPGGYSTQNFEKFKQGQPLLKLPYMFGGQGTPPPQQEAPPPEAYYNGKLRNRTRGGGYLPYGYMLGPADQIIRDPKVPDSEVEPSNIQTGFDPSQPRDPRFVPPNSIDPKVLEDILKNREERVRPQPEVNPGRTTIPRPKPSVNPGMVTPKFEPPTPSIIQDPTRRTPKPPTGVPQVPKVPKRPTRGSPTGTPKAPVKTKPLGGTKPRPKPIERGQESTGPAVKGIMAPKPKRKKPTMPSVDPERIKTTAPKKPKGLGRRSNNPNVPSAFKGINTNRQRP